MTTERALYFTGVLIGGFLSMVFIGYFVLSFYENRKASEINASRKFAGMFSFVLGLILLGTWLYLASSGWGSFMAQKGLLSVHVLLELASALTLILGGIGMLRGWSRGVALYMTANGIFLYSTMLTVFSYGNQGHPTLMNGISILLMIVSVYIVGLVYGWEHFVLHLDESRNRS